MGYTGQEKYRSLAKNFYKGAGGIILIYDITQKKAFDNIKIWCDDFEDHINTSKVAIIIVGNKSDLSNVEANNKEISENYCEQYNLIETSWKIMQILKKFFTL